MTRQERLCWSCAECGKEIEDGEGYVVVRYDGDIRADRERWRAEVDAVEAAATAEAGFAGLGTAMDLTSDVYFRRPSLGFKAWHAECDPQPDRNERYWWHVERSRTLRQCVGWASALAEKSWVDKEDVSNFLGLVAGLPVRRVGPGPGVYCILSGDFVKIGKSEKCVVSRVRELQTAHPTDLKLLGVLSDNPSDESKFHKRFAAQRARGEWFRLEGELLAFLRSERLIGGGAP